MYLTSIGTNLAAENRMQSSVVESVPPNLVTPIYSGIVTALREPINGTIASRGIQQLNPFRIRYLVHVIVLVSLSIFKQHREDIGNLAPRLLCCRREVG